MANNGFQQSGKIARRIAQMPSTTGSLKNMHDKEIEKKDHSVKIPYRISETRRSLKEINNKMQPDYEWIVTTTEPQVGAEMIKAKDLKNKLTPEAIGHMYDTGKAITFHVKSADEYVTWIKK
ncbi:MAG: hypothetical protein AJITA_00768 [Acetilactobacillus jinshanensis]